MQSVAIPPIKMPEDKAVALGETVSMVSIYACGIGLTVTQTGRKCTGVSTRHIGDKGQPFLGFAYGPQRTLIYFV